MSFEFLDPSRFVPPNYPELAELRKLGCPVKQFRQQRIDYTREFFCYKWGPSFRCLCPPKECYPCGSQGTSQFRGVGQEMKSLDYFSALPIRPEGRYSGREPPTLAQKMGLIPMDPCPKRTLGYSTTCETLGARFKSDLMKGDSICGTCALQGPQQLKEPFSCEEEFPGFDISPDLPFRVCPTEYPEPEKIRIRTGAERCLQPSRYRQIESGYKEVFKDFMKSKTPKQISLYRTPLVIDNRRPRITIPCDNNPDIVIGVNDGPLVLNAKAIRFKNCNNKRRNPPCMPEKPDFEVILPGPITLPC